MTAKTLFSCNIATAFLSLIITSKFIGGYGNFCSGTFFFTQVIWIFCEHGCKSEVYMYINEFF